jgi:hypothetical protein
MAPGPISVFPAQPPCGERSPAQHEHLHQHAWMELDVFVPGHTNHLVTPHGGRSHQDLAHAAWTTIRCLHDRRYNIFPHDLSRHFLADSAAPRGASQVYSVVYVPVFASSCPVRGRQRLRDPGRLPAMCSIVLDYHPNLLAPARPERIKVKDGLVPRSLVDEEAHPRRWIRMLVLSRQRDFGMASAASWLSEMEVASHQEAADASGRTRDRG